MVTFLARTVNLHKCIALSDNWMCQRIEHTKDDGREYLFMSFLSFPTKIHNFNLFKLERDNIY